MPEILESGSIRHRRVSALLIAAAPGVVTLLVMFASLPTAGREPWWLPFTSLAIIGSWLAVAIFGVMAVWPHERRGRLCADRRGVSIDDALVVPANEISAAVVARSPAGKPVVRLRLVGRLLTRWIPARDDAEARRLVAALGFDAAHKRTSYRLPWRLFRMGQIVTFYLFSFFGVMPISLMAGLLLSPRDNTGMSTAGSVVACTIAIALSVAYWWLWARSRLDVTFGTDGLWMKQWGRERLVRWRDVQGIDPWPGQLVRGARAAPEGFDLVLRDGARIAFYTAHERARVSMFQGDVVADRLREAMAAADKSGEWVRLPARGGQDGAAWLRELRSYVDNARAAFRSAAVDLEQLWRLVEDPTAPPKDRATAAAALTADRSEATRARIHATAEAVASPRLRVALEAASGPNDAELIAALDELEDPAPVANDKTREMR